MVSDDYATDRDRLQFFVTGSSFSGHGWLRRALGAHPHVRCHGDLLHPRPAVRLAEHAEYFGSLPPTSLVFEQGKISVEQFFNHIFSAAGNHDVVGIRLPYERIVRYDLWSYLDTRAREGDFCLIHVQRNPVACCLKSMKEKQENGKSRYRKHALYVDTNEFCESVRKRLSVEAKLNRMCRYRVVVEYDEWRENPVAVIKQICRFLGVRFSPACIPNRPPNSTRIRAFVANWDQLYRDVPADIRKLMDTII